MPKDMYINVRVTKQLKEELTVLMGYTHTAESTLAHLLIRKGLATMPEKGTQEWVKWWESLGAPF